jgi:hypothetical protein
VTSITLIDVRSAERAISSIMDLDLDWSYVQKARRSINGALIVLSNELEMRGQPSQYGSSAGPFVQGHPSCLLESRLMMLGFPVEMLEGN